MLKRLILLVFTAFLVSACDTNSENNQELPTLFVLENSLGSPTVQPLAMTSTAIVTVTPIDNAAMGILNFWEATSDTLENGEPDVWRFVGQAGDNVTVRVLGRGAEPTAELQTASGDVLGSGDSITATLPESASYTVIVSALNGVEGNYDIGLGYADRPHPDAVTPTLIPEVVGVPTPIPPYANLGAFITRLTPNNTVGGTLEADGVDHIYTYEGTANQYIQIELNRVSGELDPHITLYNPEGAAIATDDDSGGDVNAILRNIFLTEDGLYSVQISGGNLTGGYSVRLLSYANFAPVTPTVVAAPTETPAPTYFVPTPAFINMGNRLEDHIPVTGYINQPGDVAIYPFYVAQGEIVTVGVNAAEGSTVLPEVEISDPDGVIVGQAQGSTSQAGGDALVANFRAEIEGTHTVFIRGEAGTTGQFVVSYGRGSTRIETDKGETPFGEHLEGIINRRGVRDIWSVYLRAGDIITASAAPVANSFLDPILELVRADDTNTLIAIDDNGGGTVTSLIRSVTIQESGLYLFRVKAAQAASVGAYSLIWRYINVAPTSTPPPASAPILVINDVVNDTEYRFFPFYGRAGQRVRISVIPLEESELDAVAALLGIEGEVLIEVDDSNGSLNPVFEFILPVDGTYTLRVNGYLTNGQFLAKVEELF